jgi:signal transduction histidine kinase
VLLNLFTNAFYSVAAKQKQAAPGYQPEVSVSTEVLGSEVGIKVHDNGLGIAPEIREKIFQPFFTTKPTGEGTGLGLSLSYEIIYNGCGGTLRVESEPGEFAEFIVTLPLKSAGVGVPEVASSSAAG